MVYIWKFTFRKISSHLTYMIFSNSQKESISAENVSAVQKLMHKGVLCNLFMGFRIKLNHYSVFLSFDIFLKTLFEKRVWNPIKASAINQIVSSQCPCVTKYLYYFHMQLENWILWLIFTEILWNGVTF